MSKKILIYDGSCNVCTVAGNVVEKRDGDEQFDLVDMHSARGKELQEKYGIDAEKSAYVIEDDVARDKSDMALYVLENLGWFEKLIARIGRLMPKKAADAIYGFISRNRKFFNKNTH